jgi:hypothetical protein
MISEAENIYVDFGHKLTIAVYLYYSYGLHLIWLFDYSYVISYLVI